MVKNLSFLAIEILGYKEYTKDHVTFDEVTPMANVHWRKECPPEKGWLIADFNPNPNSSHSRQITARPSHYVHPHDLNVKRMI